MKEATLDIFRLPHVDDVAICITTNGTIKVNGGAVMGRGCAAQAKDLYQGIDRILGSSLRDNGNHVVLLCDEPNVIAFPVKHHWYQKADIALVARSLNELEALVNKRKWRHVYLPRPGCGNGSLDWEDVKPLCASLDDRFIITDLPYKAKAE